MHGSESLLGRKQPKGSAFDRQVTASITLIALSAFCHGILAQMPKIDIELNQIFFNLAIVLRFNYNL
jgi:hypothetical protein